MELKMCFIFATFFTSVVHGSELRNLSMGVKAFYELVDDGLETEDYLEIMEYLDQRFHRKCFSQKEDYKTTISTWDMLRIVGKLETEVQRLSTEMTEITRKSAEDRKYFQEIQEEIVHVKENIVSIRNETNAQEQTNRNEYIQSKVLCDSLMYANCLSGECCLTMGVQYPNLALGKPAWQSSASEPLGRAEAAVDGDRNSIWEGNSCIHTAREANPWWMVDLTSKLPVGRVVIVNRGDCCGDRLRNVVVTVSSNRDSNGDVCGRFQGPGTNKQIITIYCTKRLYGRYVKVTMNSNNHLHICEVEVYSG